MNRNQELGRFGEAVAARCLLDRGLQVIERNWRCARGELDLVAQEGQTLVFCEVKTRSSAAFGLPGEAVPGLKAARIRSLGLQWLADHPGHWAEIRFDVVSVLLDPAGPPKVRHLRAAF